MDTLHYTAEWKKPEVRKKEEEEVIWENKGRTVVAANFTVIST